MSRAKREEPAGSSPDSEPTTDRLAGWFRRMVLKPASAEEAGPDHPAAQERERLVALAAAPLAAAIALVVTSYLIAHDPPARLPNGELDKLHASVATYHLLELVLLALAAVILVSAWYRKRLFVGIAMALYGLAVFNLHYWGFGVPFLFGGAWYLVRAYRSQQADKQARAGDAVRARPRANRRYTPPA